MRHVLRGYSLLLCWMGVLCLPVHGAQGNPMRAPAAMLRQQQQSAVPTTPSYPGVVLDMYLRFFQSVISPVDGARSNMYPTGSAYAREAIKKHGALVGLVLTTERLMHEGNEGISAPRIRKYGLWRIYDPVEANDWWWQESDWTYQPQPERRP
jgi:uncharacterized protein